MIKPSHQPGFASILRPETITNTAVRNKHAFRYLSNPWKEIEFAKNKWIYPKYRHWCCSACSFNHGLYSRKPFAGGAKDLALIQISKWQDLQSQRGQVNNSGSFFSFFLNNSSLQNCFQILQITHRCVSFLCGTWEIRSSSVQFQGTVTFMGSGHCAYFIQWCFSNF